MAPGSFRFENFVLDSSDRQLRRDGAPVELNGRYLDALTLLVSQQGKLVSKDRFLDDVWRGIPVTDEALTQCIRTLRKQLGDDAASPRFIETVPKHGYRFIAPVESVDSERPTAPHRDPLPSKSQDVLLLGLAGTLGGGCAGVLGGLFYGFAGASQPMQPGMGAASVFLVLLCISTLVAVLGAAGVAFGIAAANWGSPRIGALSIGGGALGGLVIGAAGKLLGLDAFNLLLGRSPGDITGPMEGALLGAAVGLGAWLANRAGVSLRRGMAYAGLIGLAAGILVSLLGGRLLGGSLALLAQQFPASRLRLDRLGALFGEDAFGPVSQTAMAGVEGLLFAACVVGAMRAAREGLRRTQ